VIVDPSGRGHQGYPIFQTLEQALQHVVWGGSVLVVPGRIPIGAAGPAIINKAVTIRGLEGTGAYVFEVAGPECIAIAAPSVIIQGATWVGGRGGEAGRACVRIDSGNLILRNNIFDWQSSGPAIWARGGHLRVDQTRVASHGPALHAMGGEVSVDRSELRSKTVAALTERASKADFTNMRFLGGSRAAIHSIGSQTTVARSEIIGGYYGIVVTSGAPGVMLVEGNSVHDQQEAALFFGDDAKAVIRGNHIVAPDCKDGSTRNVEWDNNECGHSADRHRHDHPHSEPHRHQDFLSNLLSKLQLD
jgi:hypothetical protein